MLRRPTLFSRQSLYIQFMKHECFSVIEPFVRLFILECHLIEMIQKIKTHYYIVTVYLYSEDLGSYHVSGFLNIAGDKVNQHLIIERNLSDMCTLNA